MPPINPLRAVDTCTLRDFDALDFPHHIHSAYNRTAPQPGDLCHVFSEGRDFLGFYSPRSTGADFHGPRWTIRARTFKILGVLRPLRFSVGFCV